MSDPYGSIPITKGKNMTISVTTRLDRKYMLPATVMTDYYSEERDGALYLVSENKYSTAILCDAIVSIETL